MVLTYLALFTLPLVTVIFVGQRMTRTDLAGVVRSSLSAFIFASKRCRRSFTGIRSSYVQCNGM